MEPQETSRMASPIEKKGLQIGHMNSSKWRLGIKRSILPCDFQPKPKLYSTAWECLKRDRVGMDAKPRCTQCSALWLLEPHKSYCSWIMTRDIQVEADGLSQARTGGVRWLIASHRYRLPGEGGSAVRRRFGLQCTRLPQCARPHSLHRTHIPRAPPHSVTVWCFHKHTFFVNKPLPSTIFEVDVNF